MMEFTLARVVMIVCGTVLLAAVIPPVATAFDNEESEEVQEQTEMICGMLDSFYRSEADEMTLSLNSILPHNSSISMDGHMVRVSSGEQTCTFGTAVELESDKEFYSSNDIVRMMKGESKVVIETLNTE